jgi:hypothetical protein
MKDIVQQVTPIDLRSVQQISNQLVSRYMVAVAEYDDENVDKRNIRIWFPWFSLQLREGMPNDIDKCFHCDAAPSRWYVKDPLIHYGLSDDKNDIIQIFGLCYKHRLQYATPTPDDWSVKEYDDKNIVIVMDVMNS